MKNKFFKTLGIIVLIILLIPTATALNWTRLVEHAEFSGTRDACVMSYQGNLYLTGAYGNEGNVWKSTNNGINWTRATAYPGGGYLPDTNYTQSRRRHGCTVWNDKMWVFGGYGNSSYRKDVISSTDGGNWSLEQVNPPVNARETLGMITFQNKMWIISGTISTADYEDSWWSSNGLNWNLANASALSGDEGIRYAFVHEDKIYVISNYASIVNSSDGITWNYTANPGLNIVHNGISFDGKIWVMNGYSSFPTKQDEIWYSTNGVDFTLDNSTPGWGPRTDSSILIHNNRIYLIGGRNQAGTLLDDIWVSEQNTSSLVFQSVSVSPSSMLQKQSTTITAWITGVSNTNSVTSTITNPISETESIKLLSIGSDLYRGTFSSTNSKGNYYVTTVTADSTNQNYGLSVPFVVSELPPSRGGSPSPKTPTFFEEEKEVSEFPEFVSPFDEFSESIENIMDDILQKIIEFTINPALHLIDFLLILLLILLITILLNMEINPAIIFFISVIIFVLIKILSINITEIILGII